MLSVVNKRYSKHKPSAKEKEVTRSMQRTVSKKTSEARDLKIKT